MEKIEVTTLEQIEELGSALTWEGLDTSDESLDQMFNWIGEHTPVKTRRVYVTLGDTMNRIYGLTGINAYPDDLHIVSVALDDIEEPWKICLQRFDVGGRWLDDIVANNLRHEERNESEWI